ncbi:MAG: hypothetical protein ACFFAY_14290 [Promethearchaeota archaeon]
MQPLIDETLIVFNAIVGVVLLVNVLVILYVKKLQDERYVNILGRAGRNGFLFLMMVLPFLSIFQFLSSGWSENGVSVLVVWISSLLVFYGSSYYYYKR